MPIELYTLTSSVIVRKCIREVKFILHRSRHGIPPAAEDAGVTIASHPTLKDRC